MDFLLLLPPSSSSAPFGYFFLFFLFLHFFILLCSLNLKTCFFLCSLLVPWRMQVVVITIAGALQFVALFFSVLRVVFQILFVC